LNARQLYLAQHFGVGNVPTIPRQQKVHAVGRGQGDVSRVASGLGWHRIDNQATVAQFRVP
jgi:hypothetical protein